MKIDFYRHSLDETDIAAAVDTLRSLFLTSGPMCKQFEEAFARRVGLNHAVSLSSCTAALHLGLLALGIGPGDEVITTPMTFIASATSIIHTGATPVLADVEPETGLLSPEAVRRAITDRTKAILPVHLYGTMADMKAFRKIADEYNLAILEDAAHCIEAERDGMRPGDLSQGACYSFYATKNLTCGEGGGFATNDEALAEKVRLLRQHGMNKEAADRYHGKFMHWDMVELGWKYNLSDINAALLVHQIERLDDLWEGRRAVHDAYVEALADIPQVDVPPVYGKGAYHLFTIQVPEGARDGLLSYLTGKEIGVAVNYRAIHTLSWFRKEFGYDTEEFPEALRIGRRTLSLPFYPGLSVEQIGRVADAVKCFFAG
ncbi:MAG: DegT/DnrJ/EryC1/StrS family aminotransferase [Pseudodesulfovibrio sp.]|uniref:DegT/DnrJ/EryC1/StrS family aminotransferase n=1 Tax=Pseudodesulfovibrio sp. TaxID=2035812 RepID=UPI003D0DB18C